MRNFCTGRRSTSTNHLASGAPTCAPPTCWPLLANINRNPKKQAAFSFKDFMRDVVAGQDAGKGAGRQDTIG